jgi:hypothetical protein
VAGRGEEGVPLTPAGASALRAGRCRVPVEVFYEGPDGQGEALDTDIEYGAQYLQTFAVGTVLFTRGPNGRAFPLTLEPFMADKEQMYDAKCDE